MAPTPRASKRRKVSQPQDAASSSVNTPQTGSARRSTRLSRATDAAQPSSPTPIPSSTAARPSSQAKASTDANNEDAISDDELQQARATARSGKRASSSAHGRSDSAEADPLTAQESPAIRTSGRKRKRTEKADAVDSSPQVSAKTQPKFTNENSQTTPVKRGPGRPRKSAQATTTTPVADTTPNEKTLAASRTPRSRRQPLRVAENVTPKTPRGAATTPTPATKGKRGPKPKLKEKPRVPAAETDGENVLDQAPDGDIYDDGAGMDTLIDQIANETVEDTAPMPQPANDFYTHTEDSTPAFETLRRIALAKLTQNRPMPLQNLSQERAKLHALLHATVTASEGNSMLLIGARGTGKSALVADVLRELDGDAALKGTFHTIHLDGLIQTDDRLALREIWRQLGRELDPDEDEDDDAGRRKSYADMLATLLGVLSHPEELAQASGADDMQQDSAAPDGNASVTAAHAIVFVLSTFESFASRPRQTLLYNLLDVAQARKAPVAILGLTARADAPDLLEKRVKSRFSHRTLLIPAARSLPAFLAAARAAVAIEPAELAFAERASVPDAALDEWNAAVDGMLAAQHLTSTLTRIYHTSKSLPAAQAALLMPTHTLSPTNTEGRSTPPANADSNSQPATATATEATATAPATAPAPAPLQPPPTPPLHTIPHLPLLSTALLIASARLPHLHAARAPVTLALAHAEYARLAGQARVRGTVAALGGPGAGGGGGGGCGAVVARAWGRAAARGAWECLVRAGLVVPEGAAGAGGAGAGAAGVVGETDVCRVEVGLEEIEAAGRGAVAGVMARWCREL